MDMAAAQRNETARQGLTELDNLLSRDASGHAPSPSEDRRPFIVGWGLIAALHRQAHAVVALHKLGLGHEAAPNRRLMIEYMAQLHWLAEDSGSAVDSMNKKFQKDHGNLRQAVDSGGVFAYDADVAALADEVRNAEIAPDPANTYNGTSHLLNRLGSGLNEIWRSETQHSHSGIAAARVFFDNADESSVQLYANPHYGEQQNPRPSWPSCSCSAVSRHSTSSWSTLPGPTTFGRSGSARVSSTRRMSQFEHEAKLLAAGGSSRRLMPAPCPTSGGV
ncbi:hypothetical protein [Streptomyces sp. NPDC026092]|uniref:hypothetical protein n=1 Tax=Streptomyces sp. NPDC026092 TaxID=3154797 RepID=UPI0033D53B2F